MILSIGAEKAFDKVQHPFLLKTLHSVGTEGTYLNIIKAIYEKPTENIILNGEKQRFSLKLRNTAGMSPITTAVQYSTRSPSLSNQTTTKKNKNIQIGKEEVKLSLSADDMILYVETKKTPSPNC